MSDRIHPFADESKQILVQQIGIDQGKRRTDRGEPIPGLAKGKIIQPDHPPAAGQKLSNNVTADESAGPADQRELPLCIRQHALLCP